ncbi:MAG: hypothetical protein ACKOAO_02715 [Oxalobacteraceae bacterium]
MTEDDRLTHSKHTPRDKDLEFDVFHVEGDVSHLPAQRFAKANKVTAPPHHGDITRRETRDQSHGPALENVIKDARIAQQEALIHTRDIKNHPITQKSFSDSHGPTAERVITDAASPEHRRIISDGSGPLLDRVMNDGDGPITNRELPNQRKIIDLLEETLQSQRDALKQIRAMRDSPGPAFTRISTDAVGPPRIRQSTDSQGPGIQAVRYAPGSGPINHTNTSSLSGPRIDKNLGTGDLAERIRIARSAQQTALSLLKSMHDADGPSDARDMLDIHMSISKAREAQLRAMASLQNIVDYAAPRHAKALSDAEGPAGSRALSDSTENLSTHKLIKTLGDGPVYTTQPEGHLLARRSSDSRSPELTRNLHDAEGPAIASGLSEASRPEQFRMMSDATGPSQRREMSDAEGPVIAKNHVDATGPSEKRVIKNGIGPKFIRAIKDLFASKAKKPPTKSEVILHTHSISITERMAKVREEQLKTLEMLNDTKEK